VARVVARGSGIGHRLAALLDAADVSGREADRLAGRPEGIATQIIAAPQGERTMGVVSSYARALGCTVAWLGAAEGEAPTVDEVRAAVRDARARLAPV